uniref:Uncharacterized protein n=1 Tax=Solanum lycopersicum TaxID=4081 RepID=A0A3Q7GKX5_SOLLC
MTSVLNKPIIQVISTIVEARLVYSASAELPEIVDCFLDFQDIGESPYLIRNQLFLPIISLLLLLGNIVSVLILVCMKMMMRSRNHQAAKQHASLDRWYLSKEGLCWQGHSQKVFAIQFNIVLDRAKQSTKSAILMNLESRMVASEDIGRQLLTYGERYALVSG